MKTSSYISLVLICTHFLSFSVSSVNDDNDFIYIHNIFASAGENNSSILKVIYTRKNRNEKKEFRSRSETRGLTTWMGGRRRERKRHVDDDGDEEMLHPALFINMEAAAANSRNRRYNALGVGGACRKKICTYVCMCVSKT